MGLVPPKSENLPNFNSEIYTPFCYLMPFQNELSQRPGIGLKLKVIYHTSKILPLAITFGHTICIIVQLFTLNDYFDSLIELKNENKSIILLNENKRAKDI